MSQIAKNGYLEEERVLNELNKLRNTIHHRVPGNLKTDIISEDKTFRAQVKKSSPKRFQQVLRTWTSTLTDAVPSLKPIEHILKYLCELPVQNGKCVGQRVKLTNANDNQVLINILNANKRAIVEYVLLGDIPDMQPTHLIIALYKKNVRTVITKTMHEVIDEICSNDFKIRKSQTVIELGKLTIQRKGGDGGKKSANQIQFKLVPF